MFWFLLPSVVTSIIQTHFTKWFVFLIFFLRVDSLINLLTWRMSSLKGLQIQRAHLCKLPRFVITSLGHTSLYRSLDLLSHPWGTPLYIVAINGYNIPGAHLHILNEMLFTFLGTSLYILSKDVLSHVAPLFTSLQCHYVCGFICF